MKSDRQRSSDRCQIDREDFGTGLAGSEALATTKTVSKPPTSVNKFSSFMLQSSSDGCDSVVLPNSPTVDSLPTPILVEKLDKLLVGYDINKRRTLIRGFNSGFIIPSSILGDPEKHGYINHKTIDLNLECARKKIETELQKGRISGPFTNPPFENLVCSPLGLVPKKTPGEFRLIHDLSFPKGNSVNSHIDPFYSAVQYEVLDNCVELIQNIGRGCLVAKADLLDAFRIIPVAPSSYHYLGFKWKGNFYFDKCLPMGCSISCQTFESLSQALQWILVNKLSVHHTSHILDDFIFFGKPNTTECRKYLHSFLSMAEEINLPVKDSKTVWPTTSVILHGILVDTCAMQLSLPDDKVQAARQTVDNMFRKKKVQLRELQSLIGVLNFACRVIVPGRAFLRRLINLTRGVTKPHYFIKLDKEARKDLAAWKLFLDHFNGRFLCLPNRWSSSDNIKLFSDACGFGFAAIFGTNWIQGSFPESWKTINIAIKELLPIVLAVRVWGSLMANSRILFMTDNQSIVYIINSQTSKDEKMMELVRSLVVCCMKHNIDFRAKHIPGKFNVTADLLSRFQTEKALRGSATLKGTKQQIPEEWLPW